MRTGGQLLVESLIALGVTNSFGVPGESYLAVLDAIHGASPQLGFVLCRNEGGAAFMAEAYGKLTGRPGICFVTRGPGATNASIGIHTARQNSTPLLVFVGQVGTEARGREAFQEIDYRAYLGTVAKWVTEVDRVERLPEIIGRAFMTALSGRPGPVVVALPEDVLTAVSPAEPLRRFPSFREPAPSARTLDDVRDLLAASLKPLILVGGGGWTDAGRASLRTFAERSGVPVVVSFRHQDLIDNRSVVYAGDAGVGMTTATRALIRGADTILAVNVRFGEMTTDGYTLLSVPEPKQTLIHAHASDGELGKIYQPEIAIHAGPNAFFESLEGRPVEGRWEPWRQDARSGYLDSLKAPRQPSPVDMGLVTAWLQAHLPEDAVLTNGAGNFTAWPNKFFQFGPRQRLLAPQSGAMGYGLPAAIAAKVAEPGRTVVCFAGDGDFQMNCQELGTAMQAGAQPIVLIVNNGSYGTIRMHQEREYPKRVFGTDLENPDFVSLAKSYGFHAERVETTEGFADAFRRAMKSASGAVLDLQVSTEALTARQTLTAIRNAAIEKLGSIS